jgi:hypothetical protein
MINVSSLTLKAISHAEGAKNTELYSLLFTLALEGSQLTRDGERRGGCEGLTLKVDSLAFNVMGFFSLGT